MRDFRDAKAMAQTLRDALKIKSISVSHSESLELVARTLGFHDWNVLSATIQSRQPIAAQSVKSTLRSPGTSNVIPVAPMRDVVFFPQLATQFRFQACGMGHWISKPLKLCVSMIS